MISETPHLYLIGNQPEFKTKLVKEKVREKEVSGRGGEGEEKKCRIVLVPNFRQTGTVVLVNLKNLNVRTVRFGVNGMGGS